MVTIAATRVPNPDYPASRIMPAVFARLLNEDWSEMTKPARSSPNNVINDERWTRKAKEANPTLNDDQAWRLGQMLKKEHFSKLGRLSVEAKRLAREAAAELAEESAA